MIHDKENTDNIDIKKLQNTLMLDDCFLPGIKREVPLLSRTVNCSSDIVRNGMERGDANKWVGSRGDYIEYSSDMPFEVSNIRIVFDSDLNRDYQNMPCCIKLNEERFRLPKTLVKDFDITLTDEYGEVTVMPFRNVHNRLISLPVNGKYKKVRISPLETYGSEQFGIFDFEIGG